MWMQASPTADAFTVPDLKQAVSNMNFADGMSGFAAGWEAVELQRMQEGSLPKELFRVAAKKPALP